MVTTGTTTSDTVDLINLQPDVALHSTCTSCTYHPQAQLPQPVFDGTTPPCHEWIQETRNLLINNYDFIQQLDLPYRDQEITLETRLDTSAFRFRQRFLPLFFPQRVFPWESLHKTRINTIFCVQLSQFEFPHAYALIPHPVSATKLTFETTGKMSNFRISFFEKDCQPPQAVNHCGNFRNSRSATPSQRKRPTLQKRRQLLQKQEPPELLQ